MWLRKSLPAPGRLFPLCAHRFIPGYPQQMQGIILPTEGTYFDENFDKISLDKEKSSF